MARSDTRTLGFDAEQLATRYLVREGAQLIDRNFRCRLGEIDIIASDGNCLAFVEVRYRGPGSYSRAGSTVDHSKQRKIIRTAAIYCTLHTRYANRTTRFDVVAIDGTMNGNYRIDWIKDAFRPADSAL
jgi:putative endonuclease